MISTDFFYKFNAYNLSFASLLTICQPRFFFHGREFTKVASAAKAQPLKQIK
jgi:hypothetical protein